METNVKKMIALKGKANSGKTTTIKRLIYELAGEDGVNLVDVKAAHRCKSYISPEKAYLLKTMLKDDADYFAAIKHNNVLLGISSSGDTRWNIENKYGYLSECDAFICASRDRGESYEAFIELSKEKKYETVHKNKIDMNNAGMYLNQEIIGQGLDIKDEIERLRIEDENSAFYSLVRILNTEFAEKNMERIAQNGTTDRGN